MKRPYLNEQQREDIYLNTLLGQVYLLNYSVNRLLKSISARLSDNKIIKTYETIRRKI